MYAVVEDYLVKTLVVQEVKDADAAVTPTLKPGQKPAATISGTVITVPVIDNATTSVMAQAAAALANAGYSVTGSMGTGTIMASKNGVNYVFVIEESYYVTLTIDGKVVEYVAANSATPSKATANSTTVEKDITGKGTGYLKDGTYTAYSTSSTTPVIAKTSGGATVIETGYVQIGTTQATSVSGLGSSSGTNKVTVTTGDVAYNKATVKIEVDKGYVDKDYTITVENNGVAVKTFTAKKDTDIKETVSLGNLTADIADSKITVTAAAVTAPITFTKPADEVNNSTTGLTYVWALDNDSAKVGEKVTGTLTITGTSTAASNVQLTSTGATAAWGIPGDVAGKASVAAGKLHIESGVITNITVNFEFTVGATTVGTLTASYT